MERGIEREKKLPLDDYLNDGYFQSRQWDSYLFQINCIRSLINPGESVLEIGCGGGMVRLLLEHISYAVDTLDVNKNLKPTYIGDISDIEFRHDKTYDAILCAEVLEHIPLEKLSRCINNIAEITKKYVVITLPTCKSSRCRLGIALNSHYKEIRIGTKYNSIAPMHYWELNSEKKCSYESVRTLLKNRFEILEENNIGNNPYHYYYILKKRYSFAKE